MWKKILLGGLIIIVAAYSFFWFSHASTLKSQLISEIEQLEKHYDVTLNYEDISVKGYPFNFDINVTKPTLSYASYNALKEENKNLEKNNIISLDGKINIKNNYMTRQVAFEIDGTVSGSTQVQKKILNWKADWSGKPYCNSYIKKSKKEADYKSYSYENIPWQYMVENIEEIECELHNILIRNTDTDERLMNIPYEYIKVTNKLENDDKRHLNIHAELKEVEVSLTWQDLLLNSIGIVTPPPEIALDIANPELLGKQNMVLKASYIGDANPKNHLAGEQNDFHLKIDQFLLSNDLYSLNLPTHVQYDQDNRQKLSHTELDWELKATPKLHDIIQNSLKTLMDELYKRHQLGASQTLKLANREFKKQELRELLEALIPSSESLENIKVKVDVSTKGSDTNVNHNTTSNNYVIRAFDIQIGNHGIKTNGEWQSIQQGEGEINIQCIQCETSLEKLLKYSRSVKEFAAIYNKKAQLKLFPMSDIMIEKIQEFMLGLGTASEDGNYQFKITNTPQGANIAGKPIQLVMFKMVSIMMEHSPYRDLLPKMMTPGMMMPGR